MTPWRSWQRRMTSSAAVSSSRYVSAPALLSGFGLGQSSWRLTWNLKLLETKRRRTSWRSTFWRWMKTVDDVEADDNDDDDGHNEILLESIRKRPGSKDWSLLESLPTVTRMHAATRPPMPGMMGMAPQANGPNPGVQGDSMQQRPYMPPQGPMGFNNHHPAQPGGVMPPQHYRSVLV